MKVSLNWAQFYSNVDLAGIGVDEILRRIGAQLGAVEDVQQWGPRYDGIYVVKVVHKEKHPNADRLHVCLIDDGGVVKGVKRNKDGFVQIVCGAPVIEVGMIVPWITPGATVPATIDKDPFVLDVRAIRGVDSPGMLATALELGLSEDSYSLLIIDPNEVGEKLAKPGTPFKSLFGLDDTVIDCENKMFTHRPDCFGILGVAREIAGISGKAFKSPNFYLQEPQFNKAEQELPITIFNDVPDLSPRLMAVVIDAIKIKPSPTWLQAGLTRVGIRPINNIVDVTNFMMQLTGQPMHAFDYDKIAQHSGHTPSLGIRMAKQGEDLQVLSGKKLKLTRDDIVVATDKIPADLAGIMGGAHTEIDKNTTRIVLTCASFDMYAIRRSSMRHGLFTDAATRYTKGQSPLQNDRIIAYAMKNILETAGGHQASKVYDEGRKLKQPKTVVVDVDFINERLGSSLSAPAVAKFLQNVEIATEVHGNKLEVTPPFWRTDLEIGEDIVEEIGRLYGYDKLPIQLPGRSAKPTPRNELREFKSGIRTILRQAGANELLTYSFVHGDVLAAYNQDEKHAYKLGNALSPALQYYRLSLLPSLLEKVHPNIKAGNDEFVLYEINAVHSKQKLNNEKLPTELEHLAAVVACDDKVAKKAYAGAPYYQAVKYLWNTLDSIAGGSSISLRPLHELKLTGYELQWAAPFEPKRSAAVVGPDNTIYGFVGEFKNSIKHGAKLPVFTAGFELDVALLATLPKTSTYRPLSKFPSSSQDISLAVLADVTFADLVSLIQAQLITESQNDDYWSELRPLDIYQDKSGTKHMTFRISLTHPHKTLTTNEVSGVLDAVAEQAKQKLGAKRL